MSTFRVHLLHAFPFLGKRRLRIEESNRRSEASRAERERLIGQRPEVDRLTSSISEVQQRNHIAEQVTQAFQRNN